MHCSRISRTELLLIFISSLIPRVLGALWLPNAFGDAYAYTEQIYYMRRAILNGSFSFANLFGFWLPLYQVFCAAVSAVAGSSFYVPKLVSAVCGGGVCVLVCLFALELTSSRQLSFAAAAIVALNPYHIFYSSSAMTDVPHAFVILLCAYYCIRGRWLLASLCGVAAGLMRIESWSLILILPLAQTLRQRRFSPLVFLSLAAGPAFWLFVSWKATGSPWKYFEIRNNYIVETLAASPWLRTFSLQRVGLDFLRFIYTCNPLVVLASLAMLLIPVKQGTRGRTQAGTRPVDSPCRSGSVVRSAFFARFLSYAAIHISISSKVFQRLSDALQTKQGVLLSFFFSHLAFLFLAYLTCNQPEIWPRYGLIFFTLGLPILATCGPRVPHRTKAHVGFNAAADFRTDRKVPSRKRIQRKFILVCAMVFALQFCLQLIDVTRMTVKNDPNVVVADFLEDQRHLDGSLKIYCEDGAIRVLSGIPLEEFRDQYNTPRYNSDSDAQAFLESLKENQVRFLVYKDMSDSRLREIILKLKAQSGKSGITLQEIIPVSRKHKEGAPHVYRIDGPDLANLKNNSRKRQ